MNETSPDPLPLLAIGAVGLGCFVAGLIMVIRNPRTEPVREEFESEDAFKTAQLRSFYRRAVPCVLPFCLVLGGAYFVLGFRALLDS